MKNKKVKKMKKGPLSNSEKSDIENYLTEDQDANSIATHLNRSESIVQKHIDSLEYKTEKAETAETVEATPDRTRTSSLFARNEKYGVTVMTEQASAAGDESRHKRINHGVHRYSDCTTTIRKSKK